VIGRISKLMQYNSELTMYAAMHFLTHGGQVVEATLSRKQISPEFAADTDKMSPIELKTEEAELQAVKRMADECRQRGIEFKLVLAGYLPAYRKKIANLQEWQDQIKKATGLEVIDLSDVGSNSAFFDRIHLNAEGSRRTAEMMVEQGLFD
jgi:lysophospholipase L1-like esterase